ncbi:MAG TPA: imidazole glycerol phosphate synthase subunit HisH [Ktedonobacterales bacterium]|jgi:glutamine amidotransferase
MITIVDYGAGNLRSIARAFAAIGVDAQVVDTPEQVERAEAVVLPGVGAAGAAMRYLKERGLDEAVRGALRRGLPFLGVCLGMQLLLGSHEEGDVAGLSLLPGRVRRFPEGLLVPQMGWNQVRLLRETQLFDGVPEGAHFYFVHSYYAEPEDAGQVVGQTEYGPSYCSVIEAGNLWGVQFHPEKSGANGLQVLRNFAKVAGQC